MAQTTASPSRRARGATPPAARHGRTAEVLIVGAGPTGLTLACELARQGIPFRLIDAEPGPRPGSRGKGVQPRTLEVFEDLGIVHRVLAVGRMAMPMHSLRPDGTVVRGGAVPAALRDRPDIPYPASLITPQWRVEEALRARLAGPGDAAGSDGVEFGTALVDLTPSDRGVSAVLTRDGTTETVTVSWLVGCDGGHSIVRKRAGIAFEGETRADVRMVVADAAVDGLDRTAWRMWRHEDGILSLCPLPSTGLFQYAATVPPGRRPDLGRAALQAVVDRRAGRGDIRLHTPEWSSLWRANVRLADRYRAGRVLLAGDAAHVHSPAGGQGMNTGIQDAHNLGWKLAAVIGGAPSTLLDSYQAERRPVAGHVIALSDALLNRALERHEIQTRRDTSTIQLDIGYRDSALVCDDRAGTAAVRAGDRAPDATGLVTRGGPRRLFELIGGGRWTVLDFGSAAGGDSAPAVRTLRVVPEPVRPGDVVDTAGHLARAYAATARTLVLIRPDGHIGMISDAGDPAAVAEHLTAIGVGVGV